MKRGVRGRDETRMTDTGIETAAGKSARIEFNGQLCIHARRLCSRSRPCSRRMSKGPGSGVPCGERRGAHVRGLQRPSGAIRVSRQDGGANETNPKVNIVSVRENGPLAINAEIVLAGAPFGTRATLCRWASPRTSPIATVPTSPWRSPPPANQPLKRARNSPGATGRSKSRPIRMDPSASPVHSRLFPEPGAQ